jgi:signal transduction histidine kinase
MVSEQKARIAFFTAIFSLVLSALVAYLCIDRLLENEKLVLHTHEVQTALGVLNSTIGAAGRNRTGFIITGNQDYRINFRESLPPIAKVQNHIKELIADNPKQRELNQKLEAVTSQRIDRLKKSVALKENNSTTEKQEGETTAQIVELAGETNAIIDQMRDEEQQLMEVRVNRSQRLFRLTIVSLALAMGLALVFFVIHYRLLEEELRARKKAERDVSAKNRELQNVNQELETFSYSVSHDLRSPLRAIDGFSHALLEDHSSQLDAEAVALLSKVTGAARRMRELIDDLLKLSRVTRGALKKERVDLTGMAEEIVKQLRQADPRTRIQFVNTPGVTVEADQGLLKIALENLLENSFKFTSKQPEGMVQLGVQKGDRGETIFIRDNGAGFDMQYADRLFGPFQRLHPVEDFPGTGIGLATTQRIIRRHGGDIWVESERDKGATFYFTLKA